MNLVQKTKQWLGDSHINVPEDWLQACVDWLHEENQGRPLAEDAAKRQVYEQWLLSDLHELESTCLPTEVSTAEKYELNGAYALQIDSIVDVGKSFYSQQQKYSGTENANTKVSAEEPEVKPWEMKPTRMLMMTLTDGRQTVKGMEYRPISSLNPQTHPGAKILVHGSVLCRHGILMLSEVTIKCLGGEVDTLMETNTILNTLQAAMDTSVEHGEKHYRQEFRGSEITRSQKPQPSQLQQQQQSQKPRLSQVQQQQNWQQPKQGTGHKPATGYKQEPYSQKYNPVKTEIQSQKVNVIQNVNQTRMNTAEDEWDDDDADLMDAFMDDMDEFDPPTTQQPATSASANNTNPLSNAGSNHGLTGSRNFTNKTDQVTLRTNQTNNATRNLSSSGMGKNQIVNRNNRNTGKQVKQQTKITSFTAASSAGNNSPGINNDRNRNLNSVTLSRKPGQSTSMVTCDDIDFEDDMDLSSMGDEDFEIPDPKPDKPDPQRGGNMETDSVEPLPRSGLQNQFQKASDVFNSVERQANAGRNTCINNIKSTNYVDEEMTVIQPTNRKPESVRVSTPHRTESSASRATGFAHIKQAVKTEPMSDVNSYVTTEYPFTYLSKVMSLPKQEEPRIHTVKAYISTLTSRLATDTGHWSLACKINDGTLAVEVDISDKVLSDMIGFSYEQSKIMRVEAASNPKIKEKLKKGIQDFQQKLVNLMCLLEIEVSSRYTRPVVVATRPITTNHIHLLHNRVMDSLGKFVQQ